MLVKVRGCNEYVANWPNEGTYVTKNRQTRERKAGVAKLGVGTPEHEICQLVNLCLWRASCE